MAEGRDRLETQGARGQLGYSSSVVERNRLHTLVVFGVLQGPVSNLPWFLGACW